MTFSDADAAAALAEAELRRGQTVTVAIGGSSMQPLFRLGDTVHISPLPPTGRYRGQVLAARDGQGLVIHRLIAWDERQCTLKGDACAAADQPLPWSSVIGEVGPEASLIPFAANRLLGSLSAAQAGLTGRDLASRLCRRALATGIMLVGQSMRFLFCSSRP